MHARWIRRVGIAAIALAMPLLAWCGVAAGADGLRPIAGPLDAEGSFAFEGSRKDVRESRRALSGIACPSARPGPLGCIVVFDEGIEARAVTLGERSYTAELTPIVLLSGGEELDAEAAASDGHYVYVTGSHARKRGGCEVNPDSGQVLRFRVDPVTFLPLRSPAEETPTRRLGEIMAALPALAPHVGRCPGEGGVDIEGMAARDGRLFFGFREPTVGEAAYVLSVDATRLFEGGDVNPLLASVRVGRGRGIRDLVAVKDGILILAGPDDEKNARIAWTVSLWEGSAPAGGPAVPKLLAALDLGDIERRKCDKRPKPEAMAVLAETPDRYRVAVLSDGLCDGGPLIFDLRR
ncbi:DUF3616 domain-containing protein [Chelatococcus reniformis]|uniref:DUF3616 domain-containing protein n=1 Tax=Chelatococcus reniformis TaxID=1494448 RepID=A0A916U501_9HYPH|nr:DUF3616 domain-containing protein [Chelatococcus reniformis]GGC58943.1 hypothetical protein GCM10010994_17210 [Chelatococcus reniformis]